MNVPVSAPEPCLWLIGLIAAQGGLYVTVTPSPEGPAVVTPMVRELYGSDHACPAASAASVKTWGVFGVKSSRKV
jgi:hypothetical protein